MPCVMQGFSRLKNNSLCVVISTILGVMGRMMEWDSVSSDSSFGGANPYNMLTVFIQNDLTRFSTDFHTERPGGKKENPVL